MSGVGAAKLCRLSVAVGSHLDTSGHIYMQVYIKKCNSNTVTPDCMETYKLPGLQ